MLLCGRTHACKPVLVLWNTDCGHTWDTPLKTCPKCAPERTSMTSVRGMNGIVLSVTYIRATHSACRPGNLSMVGIATCKHHFCRHLFSIN